MRFSLPLFALAAVLFTGCTKSSQTQSAAPQVATKPGANIKVGLVLDKGGKDDKSFNSGAFRGASEGVEQFGVQLKDVESADDAAFEPALRTFGERGYNLVIAVGFAQTDAVKKVAPQFPKTHFAIVDGRVDAPNVASLMFAEHEGSYLVGYLAGLLSKTGKVGFIGGMDIPLIRRFETAYAAGAKAANPKVKVEVNYVGVNSSAWANPVRGKELALSQYSRGVDVIFHGAGASGLGIFDAAEEKNGFVIGVDSNQNALKPGRVVTSMLKRVDAAVLATIKEEVEGKYQPGLHSFGLKDKGIDYAVDSNNEKVIGPFLAKLEEIKQKILSGEIKVPDFYEMNKAK